MKLPIILSGILALTEAFTPKFLPTKDLLQTSPNTQAKLQPAKVAYNGGPVLTGDINVYFIYYGNFDDQDKSVLEDWINGIDQTPWFDIVRQYYDQNKNHVQGPVKLAQAINDDYSIGHKISNADVAKLIANKIFFNKLPLDPNGVYYVLTADDVEVGGPEGKFCENFCAFHYGYDYGSTHIRFTFAGNSQKQCLSKCNYQPQSNLSPNNRPGADAMITGMAHELAEMITNGVPASPAWTDPQNLDIGDKCLYTYGAIKYTETGAAYNQEFNKRKFLAQQIWRLNTQDCGMAP